LITAQNIPLICTLIFLTTYEALAALVPSVHKDATPRRRHWQLGAHLEAANGGAAVGAAQAGEAFLAGGYVSARLVVFSFVMTQNFS
jgi:hypothetical protein